MFLRVLVVVLAFASVADTAVAQRDFRRGFYGGRGSAILQGTRFRASSSFGTMPYYPPYQFQFGGQFAPVQYFLPPAVLHNGNLYQTYGLSPYGYVFGPAGHYGLGTVPIPGYQPYRVQRSYSASGLTMQGGGPSTVAKPNLNPTPQAQNSLPMSPEIEPAPVVIQQAAAGDVQSAMRFEKAADSLFRTGNYNRAYSAYKSSLKADQSRGEPYLRIATVFMALGRYEPAIRYLKQGIDYKPNVAKAFRLEDVYGPGGEQIRESHLSALKAWTTENMGSPDRQLLTGAMLFFSNRKDEAAEYLKRAANTSRRPGRAATLLAAQADAFIPPAPADQSLKLAPDPGDQPEPLPMPKLKANDGNIPGLIVPPAPTPAKAGQ